VRLKLSFNVFTGTLDWIQVPTVGPADSVDTETGDHLLTETGDYLVPET